MTEILQFLTDIAGIGILCSLFFWAGWKICSEINEKNKYKKFKSQ